MIERKILIGLITNTDYCNKIKSIWDIQLLESSTAKQMANWCWEYFDKYKAAPNKEIETIFYSKLKNNKIGKDIAKEIEEDILPGLSAEYETTSVNLQYLTEETEKYFNERHIQLLTDNIQALLATGEREKAEQLVREFKPLGTATKKLDEFVLTVREIRDKNRPHPIVMMAPWLRQGQTTIIYGSFGCGKSLLAISIAYVLGVRNFEDDECEIGEWFVHRPTGTLYLDGELGEQEMDERIKQFEWIGPQPPERKIRILSVPEYQQQTEDTFYLSNRVNQQKVTTWLKDHPSYKLIVLDSASTLFGLEQENDNSEWNNKINPFLRDLRALDVACLLLHHSGKDNKRGLRGASSMGAMAHNIFRLTSHEKKDPDGGEAWFVLSKDKQRAAGKGFKTLALKYTQNVDQTETHWKKTEF